MYIFQKKNQDSHKKRDSDSTFRTVTSDNYLPEMDEKSI
jgi:hypothetical protein